MGRKSVLWSHLWPQREHNRAFAVVSGIGSPFYAKLSQATVHQTLDQVKWIVYGDAGTNGETQRGVESWRLRRCRSGYRCSQTRF
jgi:hypothetical protein